MKKTLLILWLFTLAILLWQGIEAYPKLPDPMPCSFESSGEPRDFTPKRNFFVLWSMVIITMNVIVMIVPWLGRIKPTLVNVPNKEYWLSTPERKSRFVDRLTVFALTLGILLNGLFILIFETIASAGTAGRSSVPAALFWIMVGLLCVVPLVAMLTIFRVPVGNDA
ncbi:MAG: hypothetical protein AB1644_13435 [Candidatus Zixiibacteriota bacterium]